MTKIGRSRNANTFRWLASEIEVGEIQHSSNRRDDHNGITLAFLRKLEGLGLIQVVSRVPGETGWKLLAEAPQE